MSREKSENPKKSPMGVTLFPYLGSLWTLAALALSILPSLVYAPCVYSSSGTLCRTSWPCPLGNQYQVKGHVQTGWIGLNRELTHPHIGNLFWIFCFRYLLTYFVDYLMLLGGFRQLLFNNEYWFGFILRILHQIWWSIVKNARFLSKISLEKLQNLETRRKVANGRSKFVM